MAATPVDTALSLGQKIGRYFALVSLIPSLFLVLWTYALLASGSLSGKPALRNVGSAISIWSVGKVTGIVIASLVVAFILHPLQFIITQLLEGYWGASPLAVAAMKVRTVHHRKRERELRDQATRNKKAWRDACLVALGESPGKDPGEQDAKLTARIGARMKSKAGDALISYSIAEQSASSLRAGSYPSDTRRILPTRLGNALRLFEDAAGRQYGLDALKIAPHLHLVSPERHLKYLIDAREDMDSAIRICTVGLIATALTAAFLLTKGLWLLWAAAPYTVSYLAYRGAVSAAQGYGAVISSVIDLDRFLLYKELGMPCPADSGKERANNIQLMQLIGRKLVMVAYRPEEPAAECQAKQPAGPESQGQPSG